MSFAQAAVRVLGSLTRRFHPRGTDRILRVLHPPDRRSWHVARTVRLPCGFDITASTDNFHGWYAFFYGRSPDADVAASIAKRLPPGGVAIDVGAHVGMMTLAMCAAAGGSNGARIIACEPRVDLAAQLRSNLARNGIAHVDVVEAAISDAPGRGLLFVPPPADANQGTARLGSASPHARETSKLEVATTTIDSLVDEYHLTRLDLIKIDVEGHEAAVLAGALGSLEMYRPVVIFEYNEELWETVGYTLTGALELLRMSGYDDFRDVDDGRVVCPPYGPALDVVCSPARGRR